VGTVTITNDAYTKGRGVLRLADTAMDTGTWDTGHGHGERIPHSNGTTIVDISHSGKVTEAIRYCMHTSTFMYTYLAEKTRDT